MIFFLPACLSRNNQSLFQHRDTNNLGLSSLSRQDNGHDDSWIRSISCMASLISGLTSNPYFSASDTVHVNMSAKHSLLHPNSLLYLTLFTQSLIHNIHFFLMHQHHEHANTSIPQFDLIYHQTKQTSLWQIEASLT